MVLDPGTERNEGRRMVRLLREGCLFAFLDADPVAQQTTNPIESFNARIRALPVAHRGMSANHLLAMGRDLEPCPRSSGQGSKMSLLVDAMERCGNRRPRVERLVSTWDQGIRADAESEDGSDDPLIGASVRVSQAHGVRRAHTGGCAFIHDSLRLLTDATNLTDGRPA